MKINLIQFYLLMPVYGTLTCFQGQWEILSCLFLFACGSFGHSFVCNIVTGGKVSSRLSMSNYLPMVHSSLPLYEVFVLFVCLLLFGLFVCLFAFLFLLNFTTQGYRFRKIQARMPRISATVI